MLVEHRGKRPRIAASAYVAPTAVICGDVTIGEECRVLFGAVVTAEDGAVSIGDRCIVMENSVVRGRARHPGQIGNDVLIGPHAHVNGAEVEDEVFVATGAAIFPGARIGFGAELRINGVVQVNTVLAAETTVPIGWVAVGDPARLFPPHAHEEIWPLQRQLDFPRTVFDLPRDARMREATRRYADWLAAHLDDVVCD
jgi:carbonic anhydrase/acetyltransferase-like protein (isoleucine patch superfamily)